MNGLRQYMAAVILWLVWRKWARGIHAFGGLFARGLYAKYQQEGKDFVPLYKKMLHATSVTCVEDTAKIAGIDLTDKAFWRQGLQSLADEIDLFCQLVK